MHPRVPPEIVKDSPALLFVLVRERWRRKDTEMREGMGGSAPVMAASRGEGVQRAHARSCYMRAFFWRR